MLSSRALFGSRRSSSSPVQRSLELNARLFDDVSQGKFIGAAANPWPVKDHQKKKKKSERKSIYEFGIKGDFGLGPDCLWWMNEGIWGWDIRSAARKMKNLLHSKLAVWSSMIWSVWTKGNNRWLRENLSVESFKKTSKNGDAEKCYDKRFKINFNFFFLHLLRLPHTGSRSLIRRFSKASILWTWSFNSFSTLWALLIAFDTKKSSVNVWRVEKKRNKKKTSQKKQWNCVSFYAVTFLSLFFFSVWLRLGSERNELGAHRL